MLTHIDKNNLPQMVDVSEKNSTPREATAQAIVQLPPLFRDYIQGKEIFLKKGPVLQTAIIAGTMAVKKTSDLIPFCHQLPIEKCKFEINIKDNFAIEVKCSVKTEYKTGIEMEALTGASVAALTIYDMCKALSHEIQITEIKLLQKSGGKSNFKSSPTFGLVLTGGKSSRMNQDKALLNYQGDAHGKFLFHLLDEICEKTFISSKKDQWQNTSLQDLPTIFDRFEANSPLSGMISAFESHPEANWIIVACDLPFINKETISNLLKQNSDDTILGHFYKNKEKGFPEALCGFYKTHSFPIIKKHFENGITCPVKILKNEKVILLDQLDMINLDNINTPEEFARVQNEKY